MADPAGDTCGSANWRRLAMSSGTINARVLAVSVMCRLSPLPADRAYCPATAPEHRSSTLICLYEDKPCARDASGPLLLSRATGIDVAVREAQSGDSSCRCESEHVGGSPGRDKPEAPRRRATD